MTKGLNSDLEIILAPVHTDWISYREIIFNRHFPQWHKYVCLSKRTGYIGPIDKMSKA